MTLAAVCLSFCRPVAYGTIVVQTQAQLDWSGFTYTISPGLSVSHIDVSLISSGSTASTSLGGFNSQSNSTGVTSANSTSATAGGASSAVSSTNNGLLMSQSNSSALGTLPTALTAAGQASVLDAFWFYGSGVGTLTVSIPYSLQIAVQASGPAAQHPSISSGASVSLSGGPAASEFNPNFATASLAWLPTDPVATGSLSKSGVLTITRIFNNPTWGPLVSIHAAASTNALAAVPEYAESLSLALSLVMLIGFREWKKRRDAEMLG